jgi:predicted nucleic acid-binding protein
MKNRISIINCIPKKEDIFIFDTNILIDLFYPMSPEKNVADITNLYNRIIKQHATIILTSVQVSEFINRCIRFQYELYKKDHVDCEDYKKDYRITEDYKQCMDVILDIIRSEWEKNFNFVDDKFGELNKSNLFEHEFAYDFNDALIVEIARKNNAILVTNDKDYVSYKLAITIVSGNGFILSTR